METRIVITVETQEQAEKLLAVLEEAAVEGELDFAFEVRTERWMGGFWGTLDRAD